MRFLLLPAPMTRTTRRILFAAIILACFWPIWFRKTIKLYCRINQTWKKDLTKLTSSFIIPDQNRDPSKTTLFYFIYRWYFSCVWVARNLDRKYQPVLSWLIHTRTMNRTPSSPFIHYILRVRVGESRRVNVNLSYRVPTHAKNALYFVSAHDCSG
jgi:hypothetical protein